MAETAQKPYWIDELLGRQEAYFYGESDRDSRTILLTIRGRSLSLIAPRFVPDFEVREARVTGDLLLIIGDASVEDEVEDEIEEGYGIIVVARRCADRESTFWVLIAHELYPETLNHLPDPPTSQAETRI
jgi:hypothetical protein